MTSQALTWTAGNGAAIRVVVDAYGFAVSINGTQAGQASKLYPPAPAVLAEATRRGVAVVAQCGPLLLDSAKRDALLALQAALTATPDPLADLYRLEGALAAVQEGLRDLPAHPALAFAAAQAAQAALDAWKVAHPREWQAEAARRQAEIADRTVARAAAVQRALAGRD